MAGDEETDEILRNNAQHERRRQRPKGPYVYTLTDPRDGSVFYVGKGRRNRAWSHLGFARGQNGTKAARITEIEAAGLAVIITVVAEYETDQQAYQAEVDLIAKIGLEKLTNQNDGGNGPDAIPSDHADLIYLYEAITTHAEPFPITPDYSLWLDAMRFAYADTVVRIGGEKLAEGVIARYLAGRGSRIRNQAG